MPIDTINILLADDDKDDCLFFKEALEELEVVAQLTLVADGQQLMHRLRSDTDRLPDVLGAELVVAPLLAPPHRRLVLGDVVAALPLATLDRTFGGLLPRRDPDRVEIFRVEFHWPHYATAVARKTRS